MALFSKKTEDKAETKYEVSADAPKTGSAPTIKIPSILIQPRISEKAGQQAKMNKYVFKVATGTNKIEVKKAVEAAYKVRVTQVNIVRNQGKARTFGNRVGRTQAFKKAIVTLRQGDSIQGLTDVV
jgi:large subunit ribosomal protein L23